MQVLLKKEMTIFYIDYCYMKFIYYFIENNFKNKLLRKDSITLFNLQIESNFHKEVLIKWLYNLYKRKENSKKPLLESKLLKRSKTVKIIFSKPTCISIIWKIIDEKYISFKLSSKSEKILKDMESYLKTEINRLSDEEFILKILKNKKCLLESLLNNKSFTNKCLLESLLNNKSFTNITHKHRYNTKDMKNFLKDNDTKDEFYKEAYSILNLKDFTDDIRLIKKQYRLLATTYHPDLQNTSCPQTQLVYTKKFQEINSAYQTIISQF